MKALIAVLLFVGGTCVLSLQSRAQERVLAEPAASASSATDLAKQLANPVANLISVPLQNNLDFGIGPNDAIREWVKANEEAVKKVNLIFGFGYDNATLAEHRHPTREDLDQVSKDIPVCIWHQSGHIVAINSKAIEIVGTTAETPNPQGGVIRRKRAPRNPMAFMRNSPPCPCSPNCSARPVRTARKSSPRLDPSSGHALATPRPMKAALSPPPPR
jgi:hypothetical protein